MLEAALLPTTRLSPAHHKSPVLIKAFFCLFVCLFFPRLSGATTHRCQEKPRWLSFASSIRQPVATSESLGDLVGARRRLQPWSFSFLFSLVFFTIYGCFQQIRGGEGRKRGTQRDSRRPERRDRVSLLCGQERELGWKRHFLWRGCLFAGNITDQSHPDCIACVVAAAGKRGTVGIGWPLESHHHPTLALGCGRGGGPTANGPPETSRFESGQRGEGMPPRFGF